ncbi:peptidase C39 family protein [Kribbella capetownensis]|uniref:Peptidase C39 family protein n=1 Tax=Kribbella capetownensis TaxID=1572659 RepID=A0A4R0JBD7_9ACTN|nr:peptidase C39 family protein [Kribbella capetownensis]TCC43951.1 peptidase C39 family protein [Kribbella capetownensis]
MTTARSVTALIAGVVVLTAGSLPSEPAKVAPPRQIAYRTWTSTTDFLAGAQHGTTVTDDALTFGTSTGTTSYVDPFGDGTAKSYDQTSWVSPHVSTGFGLTELVASWNATTPPGTWVEVSMAGQTDAGTTTKWYVLGRWSGGDDTAAGDIHRTSVPSQGDADGSVAVDTFTAASGHWLDRWQLKVTLYRLTGTTQSPVVRSVGAMASRLPDDKKVAASPLGGAEGIVLDVPTYSQETHLGHYPQWDGGGEAWCSATSTAMVLDYYGAGPTADETAWVDPADADPQVDHSARSVFDYAYDGAGNWPFNTAYAGSRGVDGFITRLRSLTEAEQFIKAGIPLVASLSFKKGDLPGAGYGTNGHLMVIVGFDPAGNVVVNDPASHLIPSNGEVRTTYDRTAFENAWVPHSGGLVYVIHPSGLQLPPREPQSNW